MNYIKSLYKSVSDKLKIYIVDDEEYYLNLVKVNLINMGYNDIKIFNTGEECLLEIIKEKPNCIILDYLFQDGLNGDKILKQIKSKYPEIDVIILSGQEDVSIASNIIRDGATDYIVKNKMTFFNLSTSLSKLNDIMNVNKNNKNRTIRIKFHYLMALLLVWVIGGIAIYFRYKN